MKNEKLQPTNNNVYKFISNKNTCKYCTKLQIASFQVCKFASYKLQIHKLQYYNF